MPPSLSWKHNTVVDNVTRSFNNKLKDNSYTLYEVYAYNVINEETEKCEINNASVNVNSLPGLSLALEEIFDDDWGE